MEFTKQDMIIIVAMTTTVVLLAFIFSALGFAENGIVESDIPEYNTTADRFDMVGDFPDNPGGPSKFYMSWDDTLQGDSDNSVWLDGDTTNGNQLVIRNNSATSTETIKVALHTWTNGNHTGEVNDTLDGVGDRAVLNTDKYDLLVEYKSKQNENSSETISQVEVTIREQPESNAAFLKRIPIVGGVFSGAEAVASGVAWIGSILFWFLGTTFEVILNLAIMLYSAMSYGVSFMWFLLSTYFNVTTSATGWAAVMIMMPGVILFFEFVKIIMIGISLLPTT